MKKSENSKKEARTSRAEPREAHSAPLQLSFLDSFAEDEPDGLLSENEFKTRMKELCSGPVEIVLTNNRSSLITVKESRGKKTARIQHAFRAADKRTLKALAGFIGRPNKRSRSVIDEFLREKTELVESLGRDAVSCPDLNSRGEHRDLKKVLSKVRREYGINVKGVKIAWSTRGTPNGKRRRRSIKFGSYCRETNTVRVHPDLDNPAVPDYFVEYIVYHELLHAIFPPERAEGRRNVHNPEFVRFEKKFEKYSEALQFEEYFVEKMMR